MRIFYKAKKSSQRQELRLQTSVLLLPSSTKTHCITIEKEQKWNILALFLTILAGFTSKDLF